MECRFIIEKKIEELKKHYALDRRRNMEIGRLQIDYRIACAMLNFDHKPCHSDGERAVKVAEKIINKHNNPSENLLYHLLPLRLGTVDVPYKSLSDIVDFPKLSRLKLQFKVFFGSFFLSQCRMYLSDLIKNSTCVELSTDTLKNIEEKEIQKEIKMTREKKQNKPAFNRQSISRLSSSLTATKIIGVEVLSRHQRSLKQKKEESEQKVENKKRKYIKKSKDDVYIKKFRSHYTVFIQYIPNQSSSINKR